MYEIFHDGELGGESLGSAMGRHMWAPSATYISSELSYFFFMENSSLQMGISSWIHEKAEDR